VQEPAGGRRAGPGVWQRGGEQRRVAWFRQQVESACLYGLLAGALGGGRALRATVQGQAGRGNCQRYPKQAAVGYINKQISTPGRGGAGPGPVRLRARVAGRGRAAGGSPAWRAAAPRPRAPHWQWAARLWGGQSRAGGLKAKVRPGGLWANAVHVGGGRRLRGTRPGARLTLTEAARGGGEARSQRRKAGGAWALKEGRRAAALPQAAANAEGGGCAARPGAAGGHTATRKARLQGPSQHRARGPVLMGRGARPAGEGCLFLAAYLKRPRGPGGAAGVGAHAGCSV
jgi:hypothetical protein